MEIDIKIVAGECRVVVTGGMVEHAALVLPAEKKRG